MTLNFNHDKLSKQITWNDRKYVTLKFQNNFIQSDEMEIHSCLCSIKQIEVIEEKSEALMINPSMLIILIT